MECPDPEARSSARGLRRSVLTAVVAAVMATTSAAQAQAPAAPSRLAWPSVATEIGKAKGSSDDVAIVVGISNYLILPDIDGAADNARDWAQYLTRVAGLRADRVTILTDADATKERIEGALRSQGARSTAKGRVWFVFIGHGAPSPSGDDGLLLGADAQADADSLAARGVPQKFVEGVVDGSAHRDAVVVYDACFSGSDASGDKPLVRGLQATLPVRRQTAPPPVPKIVLSSSESFAGPLPGEGRPAYSYLLLGALRGWADDNGDGAVDVDEAHGFASNVIRQTHKTTARLPKRRGSAGAVVLAQSAREDKPDVMALVMQRCPDGTRWGGRSCVVVDCPKGTRFDGVSCAATAVAVQCPQGTSWNGSACVASGVSCPQGTTWNGQSCAATAVGCPAGSSWDGARCVGQQVAQAPPPPPAPAPAPTSTWSPSTTTSPWPGIAVPGMPSGLNVDDDDDDVYDVGDVGGDAGELLLMQMAQAGEAVLLPDRLILQSDRLFSSGSAKLSSQAMPLVRAIGVELQDMGVFAIAVVCHTDSAGADAFNLRLSQDRATALARALGQVAGTPNVVGTGAGEQMPIADNASSAGRKANRRCEIGAQ